MAVNNLTGRTSAEDLFMLTEGAKGATDKASEMSGQASEAMNFMQGLGQLLQGGVNAAMQGAFWGIMGGVASSISG
jgi:hypothetical protein